MILSERGDRIFDISFTWYGALGDLYVLDVLVPYTTLFLASGWLSDGGGHVRRRRWRGGWRPESLAAPPRVLYRHRAARARRTRRAFPDRPQQRRGAPFRGHPDREI